MSFRHTVTVQFDDADPRGVLFFKQKTAYEIIAGDWSSDVCSSDLWEDWFLADDFIVPIRQATATFHRPMRPGRPYGAELRITRIGKSSFDVRTRFREGAGEGDLCAETVVTHVFADPARFRSTAIPPAIRSRLEAHLAE